MAKLTPAQIKAALAENAHWKKKGSQIERAFEFEDFAEAMKFVNQVAKIAEKAQHHPDIAVSWNKVSLTLTTHDEGGLTENDFRLARKIDALDA